jgi:hypothetical protein
VLKIYNIRKHSDSFRIFLITENASPAKKKKLEMGQDSDNIKMAMHRLSHYFAHM